MDLADTQIYENEDFLCTQRFSQAPEEEEFVQVGTLSINSTDYQIKIGTTKIGRHSSCDIVIRNGTISKLHAEIEASRSQGSVWICDMKSSNRTKLNNLLLQPNRSYELKDESNLEFGEVCATYRTYRPADDVMIPETPGPSRQKIASTVIPNTPDSSLNNSSGVDDDGSIILGTQKDEENRVFRRPRIPQQRESTSIGKKNISCVSSMSEGDDSRITTVLHTSNVSKDQVSIFEVETQNFEEGYKTASNSIHDMETQGVLTDMPEHLVEANAKADKQLSKLNVCDKAARRSIMDIHDRETQNCIDDINEMETQKNKINVPNVTGEKFTTDIHNVETQQADEDSDTKKSEISKKNSQEKNLAPIGRDIHDLETQKYIAEDISDLETQLELNSITGCKQSKDISDMETQLEADNMTNETNNDRANKDKDKDDIANTTKDGISHENITKSPKSRSSSPGSLNLSSPGVDENERPSSLDQSDHLLESSDLLEFFGEDIDKQEEAQASNMSTPKPLKKVLSKRDSNIGNVRDAVNNEENDDEDIFEALTQRVSRSNFEALMSNDSETGEEDALIKCKIPKKKRGKPQSKQTNDDSETDAEEYVAELAKKQLEHSSGTLNKSNENINNRNDPGTSIESEDMFDAPTQRLGGLTTKDTNSLLDQPQEANEVNKIVDDMASTQIINNVDQDNQTNMPTPEINDLKPTQLILPRENSPKTALNSKNSKDNQNDMDDMATTQIINTKAVDCGTSENLHREDADYELAPTQVIGEIEDKEKRDSTHKKGSSQVNLNDTLEQKLSEMFADVNNDMNSIHESPHMSTQYLEDILESPQCDDSTNKSTDADIGNVRQKQLEKKNRPPCNQHSDNLLDTEVNANNVNKAETDSQMSDVYFSTITTRRKRNILRDTQELVVSLEDINPSRQDVDSSRASKANNEKTVDDNTAMESNKRRKRISKTKTLNDDNKNETILSRNNERSLRSTKKQKDETTSETSKQVLEKDSAKSTVDDAEENISICIPCPSSKNGQGAQMLNASYEIDDDILIRLPAVRISGTLSNPASPSASSMSTVYSPKSKQGTPRSKKKKKGTSLRRKSLCEWNIENSGKNDKPSVDNRSDSVLDVLTTEKISGFVDSSDESDSETKYKRFQQMAGRVLNTELSFQKRQAKGNRKNLRVSQDVSEDPKQNTDVEFKNPMPTSSRMTRHSSKRNESDIQKEVRAKNSGGARSTEPETKSAAKRKTSLNIIEEDVEQANLKKRKTAQIYEECPVSTRSRRSTKTTTDRQSPNILKYLSKMSSRESSPMIKNTKSFEDKAVSKIVLGGTQKTSLNTSTDENVDFGRSIVKQARSIIYDCQVTIRVNDVITSENSKKNSKKKPAQTKETETEVSQSPNKVLRVLLNPIKSPIDDGSQEVERIMAREPNNTQDKNLPIRESSSAKIFRRELRTRSRKRSNLDTETESVSSESGMSSEIGDSDNTQLGNSAPRNKHGKLVKRSVSSQPKAQMAQKKGTFKKPTRITHNQNSASSISDSSTENMIGESSQGSTGSDASTSSRVSRSKAASIRKKGMMELNQNTCRLLDGASALNTSAEITSLVLTPSRTRRSTSILSNSTPSVMKHKVLFTGITEDYSKIVKTLGGNKVEDPANCNVLVTDKVRRTYKFLCALAKGIPIVSIDWLRDSETAARFLEWENYILKDPATEAKFGFRLRKSLDKAKEKRLLDDYTVVLTPNVAPPPIEELKDMVSSCGGKPLLRPPTRWPKKAVVLSREEDLPTARKFLAKAPKTVTVQSTEFILTGILRQETDFDKYKLT